MPIIQILLPPFAPIPYVFPQPVPGFIIELNRDVVVARQSALNLIILPEEPDRDPQQQHRQQGQQDHPRQDREIHLPR